MMEDGRGVTCFAALSFMSSMRLRTHIISSALLGAALYPREPRRAALLALGGVLAWRAARDEARPGGLRDVEAAQHALPILTPLFYRNAFPYYYAFILPPRAAPWRFPP